MHGFVSYSQFSSIVCEKSENQITQSCHYRRNESSRDVVSPNAESFNYKSSEQSTPVLKLVLHPRLKKHMKSHQVDGLNFLQKNLIAEEHGGCILAHAPGTGKTFLMISFIQCFFD